MREKINTNLVIFLKPAPVGNGHHCARGFACACAKRINKNHIFIFILKKNYLLTLSLWMVGPLGVLHTGEGNEEKRRLNKQRRQDK